MTMIRAIAAAAALASAFACPPARAADDAFVCMEASQEKCDHENENLHLFIQGRDAYDRGRETGNLTEARKIALDLIERKVRHGKTLMTYIYLEVGRGAHKNLVEAYGWVEGDLKAGASYKRLNLERIRDQLKARMTPEQLAAVGR
jgi:hypothetical protein